MKGPEEIVQAQVDAYNARDIEAFVLCHHEEVELYQLGDKTPFAQGRLALRQRYSDLFDASPNLHSEVITRISHDHVVIDKERIIGRKGRAPFEMIAVYEIQDGKIKTARFVM